MIINYVVQLTGLDVVAGPDVGDLVGKPAGVFDQDCQVGTADSVPGGGDLLTTDLRIKIKQSSLMDDKRLEQKKMKFHVL